MTSGLTEFFQVPVPVPHRPHQKGYLAIITRRSGRRTTEHQVYLPKPADDYRVSEELTVRIDGRDLQVHVEIPVSPSTPHLGVALSYSSKGIND